MAGQPSGRSFAIMMPLRRLGAPNSRMRLRLPTSLTVTSWAIGGLTFAFRLSSLRDLTNDHYMHLSWSQQVLLGELPGRDFVDPGMPLAWASSAIVQALSPGPFSEAAFSSLMFGVAAGLTCWVTARLTGSRMAGVLAACLATVFVPRLYNYPKVLVPVLTMFLIQRYVERPSHRTQIALGAGLAAAVLYRHDLGLYAGIVTLVTLVVAHRTSIKDSGYALLWTMASALLVLAPYIVYLQWSEGIVEHVRRGIEFSKGESHGLQYPWPVFPWLEGKVWSAEDATSLLYYVAWPLPLLALIRPKQLSQRGPTDRLPLLVAAALFLALYLPIILRHPVNQRLPDLATPFAVVAISVAQRTIRAGFRASANESWRTAQRVAAYVAAVGVAMSAMVLAVNAAKVGGFMNELDDTRWERGPRGIWSKIRSLEDDAAVWPWSKYWPNTGDFPSAVPYLSACTKPDDYVLLTWASSEYFFFAQRKFASGHTMFLPPDAFTTETDQDFMIRRLTLERPPIALINRGREESFRRAYPRVDAWIAAQYTPAATYRHYDDDEIVIAIRNDLQATSTFGEQQWPCGFVERVDHPSR